MTTTAAASAGTFDSRDPATGRVLATYPVSGIVEVERAVARARDAAHWWSALGFDGRRDRLLAWRRVLTRRGDELVDVIHAETGKPHPDARLEVVLSVEHTAWAARHARRVLRRRRVFPGLLLANHTAAVEYQPYGVVGVIGPWNYPLFTPMGSIAYALAAGNAVVFKPSEHTPGVATWLAASLADVVPEQPLLQVVPGLSATGAALCRAGVDKVAFTGSTATARKVMATCAEDLVPVLVEAGGNDVLLVDADADLDAAAIAAAWGGLSNAGQTCAGVERVYVHERVAEPFLDRLTAIARDLQPGTHRGAAYGPMTMPEQCDVVRSHLEDGVRRGGRAVLGGPDAVRPPYVWPTILSDVPEDATAVQEETFGPVLVVNRVRDMDEAVERANGNRYGLAAAVFSRRRGPELAGRLRTGMASVNSVLAFAGVPGLPFGGTGDSGFGRIHGADGLREFARPRAVARRLFPVPVDLARFGGGEAADRAVRRVVTLLHGR